MEKVYYDLHIHSCLSPCGDEDMTPNNIVNMAILKGLDLIALTDHNSCANGVAVKAASQRAAAQQTVSEWETSEQGASERETSEQATSECTGGVRESGRRLLVLYGAEVETEEEVHVLCLFATLAEAQAFERELQPHFLDVKNRTDIYGNQWIMDDEDRVTGEEQRLLATATRLSFQELFFLTDRMGGAFIPAHIDKAVYSVLSNMGFLPEELPMTTVEVSPTGIRAGFLEEHRWIQDRYQVITSSDAHYLWEIAEAERCLKLSERSEKAAIHCLKYGETFI